MDTSRINVLRWSSWASLALPVVAYILCSEVSTSHLFFHAPPWGQNVVMLRQYAFLGCAVIGAIVLLGDIGFKRWNLFWLPLVSMVLTYLLYVEAARFTRFLE